MKRHRNRDICLQIRQRCADNPRVEQSVNALLDEIADLPVVPAVALRVLQFAEADAGGAAELAAILSADPALSAKLIRVSNSAYYGFTRRFSTVREAVIVLGFKQVRQMAVAASMVDAFRPARSPIDGFDMDLFWGHALTVAMISELAARKFNAGSPADAFAAGILHDIGRLALRQARPREFGRALAAARATGEPLRDVERRETGFSHDDVGFALAVRWQFPAFLAAAIGQRYAGPGDPRTGGLPVIMSMADALAGHFGINSGYESAAQPLRGLSPELAELEAACGGMQSILQRAHAFIESVTGTPGEWFEARAA